MSRTPTRESNGALAVNVENAQGPWTATWYDGEGFIQGTGETLEGLDAGDFSVLVVDSIGCSVEVEDIEVITGLEDMQGTWSAYPNPAHDVLVIQGLPLGRWSAFTDSCRTGRGQRVVPTGSFANGVYVLRVANNRA